MAKLPAGILDLRMLCRSRQPSGNNIGGSSSLPASAEAAEMSLRTVLGTRDFPLSSGKGEVAVGRRLELRSTPTTGRAGCHCRYKLDGSSMTTIR